MRLTSKASSMPSSVTPSCVSCAAKTFSDRYLRIKNDSSVAIQTSSPESDQNICNPTNRNTDDWPAFLCGHYKLCTLLTPGSVSQEGEQLAVYYIHLEGDSTGLLYLAQQWKANGTQECCHSGEVLRSQFSKPVILTPYFSLYIYMYVHLYVKKNTTTSPIL